MNEKKNLFVKKSLILFFESRLPYLSNNLIVEFCIAHKQAHKWFDLKEKEIKPVLETNKLKALWEYMSMADRVVMNPKFKETEGA